MSNTPTHAQIIPSSWDEVFELITPNPKDSLKITKLKQTISARNINKLWFHQEFPNERNLL